MTETKKWMPISEAAEIVPLSKKTIRKYARLKIIQTGRQTPTSNWMVLVDVEKRRLL